MSARITPEEFLESMKQIADANSHDREADHVKADAILCATLESLGYSEGVKVYSKLERWYA